MSEVAFRVYDWRLFCATCGAGCDVRAIDESDAAREARDKGWRVTEEGVACALCQELELQAVRRKTKPRVKEEFL